MANQQLIATLQLLYPTATVAQLQAIAAALQTNGAWQEFVTATYVAGGGSL